jgi:hypothetical protein
VVVINITIWKYYQILQSQLNKGGTTKSPRRALMEGMFTMMTRPVTISYLLPFPLTLHATQHVMVLLHSELFQCPGESSLGIPDTELLLHLLEEVRCIEPQNLLQVLRCTLLLGYLGLPAVRGLWVLHPHLT